MCGNAGGVCSLHLGEAGGRGSLVDFPGGTREDDERAFTHCGNDVQCYLIIISVKGGVSVSIFTSTEQPVWEEVREPPLPAPTSPPPISYEMYESELQMPCIMRLMKTALSEPYSIYTYRYFIHNWPQLCMMAQAGLEVVGAIVCKLEIHHYTTRRGYIAMLAVHKDFRKRKIGEGRQRLPRHACTWWA